MDKRKITAGILIALIILVTGWLLLSMFKNNRKTDSQKVATPTQEAKKETVKTEKSDVLEGKIKKISAKSLTLQTDSGEKVITIQEDKTKFFVKGEADALVETAVGELKEGSEVAVIYQEIKEQEIAIASGVFQGAITDITGEKITLKSESETKTFKLTDQTTIYMTVGDKDVDQKVSDLKANSLVSVIFATEKGELTALGVRIDKL